MPLTYAPDAVLQEMADASDEFLIEHGQMAMYSTGRGWVFTGLNWRPPAAAPRAAGQSVWVDTGSGPGYEVWVTAAD